MSDEQTIEEVENTFYPADDAEPLEKPTEEIDQDEDPEKTEEVLESDDDDADEVETEGKESTDDDKDDEGDIEVHVINGKEYTAEDIDKLESGNMMQAAFTQKTQALAKDREKLDGDVTSLSEAITKTNDLAAQLEVLVAEDGEINWTELKEDDPDEYIRLKERSDNRATKLKEVKANNVPTQSVSFNPEDERAKLVEANPHWLKDGKATEAYSADMELMSEYYKENKVTQEEATYINQSSRVAQLVLEEAKRQSKLKVTTEKKAKIKRKIVKAPKGGKSKATTDVSQEDIFYPD